MVKKRHIRVQDKHEYFYAVDGKVIKSLPDLHLALTFMDDRHFYFHVNEEKNDFSNWVDLVLNEKKLAEKINKHDNRIKVLGELTDFLRIR